MKSIIIDTNAFLRLLLSDIQSQADQVERLILQAKKGQIKIIVPQVIFFEIDFILRKYYGFEKIEVIEKLQSLVSASYFRVESRDVFQKALYFYSENSISFVDCFLIAKSWIDQVDIFTFDKDLNKLKRSV